MNIFSPQKILFFLGVFCTKMIKNLIFNKTKNTFVHFFIYMSSRCVQLFTASEEVVFKLCVPW